MTLSIPNTFPPAPAAEVHATATPATTTATTTEQSPAAGAASEARLSETGRVHQLKELGRTPSEISVELSLPPATVNTDLFIGVPKMVGSGIAGSVSLNA